MCSLLNLNKTVFIEILNPLGPSADSLMKLLKYFPMSSPLIVQPGTLTSQICVRLMDTGSLWEGGMLVFLPLRFSKASIIPHSYVFHFLSQMKTLTPDLLEFSINAHINVNRLSAEFHCLHPLLSKIFGGLLSGIEHVCNKWGRWQVKYFVLGGKKEKIIRTNDGYPLNPEKHGCYFHSWGQ